MLKTSAHVIRLLFAIKFATTATSFPEHFAFAKRHWEQRYYPKLQNKFYSWDFLNFFPHLDTFIAKFRENID